MSNNPEPRKGMPSPRLPESEFKRRFLAQFQDPAFDSLSGDLQHIAAAAWDGYSNSRKSPCPAQHHRLAHVYGVICRRRTRSLHRLLEAIREES
jgi:hypothetical protein